MSRRRTIVSTGFAVLTGTALFATAGSAAADDTAGKTVLRIVTVQADDPTCTRHTGSASGQGSGPDRVGQAHEGTGAL